MAANLVGLAAIKRLANVSETDARWDDVLNLLRDRVGSDVEDITGRQFPKQTRTEFFQSYPQEWGDPTPQWIFPNAFPIDEAASIALTWAPFDDHDTNGTDLEKDKDWRFERDHAGRAVGIRVQRFSSFPQNFPLPLRGGSILRDSPTGFRLTYDGGFDLSAAAPTPGAGENVDCFLAGEAEVVQFDAADAPLADLAAQKAAADFQYLREQRALFQRVSQATRGEAMILRSLLDTGAVLPWNPLQRQVILSHARKDLAWVRPGAATPSAAGRGVRVAG